LLGNVRDDLLALPAYRRRYADEPAAGRVLLKNDDREAAEQAASSQRA
jgi:hypothetical protein